MSNEKNAVLVRESENRAAELRYLDRLFESVFGESPLRHAHGLVGMGWTPAVDIRETEGELILTAALPGLTKQDVNLEIKENTLVISGTLKTESGDQDSWVRRELPRGEFYRAFSLPADVLTAKAKAAMANGVLEIRLPKAVQAKPRRISID